MSTHPKKNVNPADTLSFADRMTALETIVKKMESGELPLEDALSAYAEGTKLIEACQAALQQAEQTVMILNQQQKLSSFEPD